MAYTRITFRGVTLSTRTRDMILAAEKILGWQLVLTQGSYNKGGVTASAGTHDGGGAVDVRARDLTDAQKTAVVVALRQVGFASWHRLPSEGNWVEHIHSIAIGDAELSAGAKAQVADYKAGRNGLANKRADNATRAYVNVTWEIYKAQQEKPVLHAWSINYATQSKGMSGQTLAEAKRFVGFAFALKAISDEAQSAWNYYVDHGQWTKAGPLFFQILKSVQAKGRLPIDGVFGPVTGGFVDNYGYRIIY